MSDLSTSKRCCQLWTAIWNLFWVLLRFRASALYNRRFNERLKCKIYASGVHALRPLWFWVLPDCRRLWRMLRVIKTKMFNWINGVIRDDHTHTNKSIHDCYAIHDWPWTNYNRGVFNYTWLSWSSRWWEITSCLGGDPKVEPSHFTWTNRMSEKSCKFDLNESNSFLNGYRRKKTKKKRR